jgi:hypothetical protein
MKLDAKALDVAVETLRPLFREPVTYLEQAARDCIAAYLTAAAAARVEALEAARTEAREWLDKYLDATREGEPQMVRGGLLAKLIAALSPERS